MKRKIKKSDMVRVLTGKDKGKSGKVIRSFPSTGMVVVEGINIRTRHEKAKKQTKQGGGIVKLATPIPVSNVALIDPKTNVPTRVGRVLDTGRNTLVRVTKKSGTKLS